MFAVPGWSLPSDSLKRQTAPVQTSAKAQAQAQQEAAPPTPAAQPTAGGGDGPQQDAAAAQPKKRRKNKNGKGKGAGAGAGADVKVTKANVDELFRKVIQGEGDAKGAGSGSGSGSDGKAGGKKRKLDDAAGGAGITTPTSTTTTATEGQPKKQKRNRKKSVKQGKDHDQKNQNQDQGQADDTATPPTTAPPAAAAKLTPLQQAMRNKLLAARFRYLNEQLYTTPSSEAAKLFAANPTFFEEYHAGFARQVQEQWPANPVDGYIAAVRARGAVRPTNREQRKGAAPGGSSVEALPRRPNGSCTLADMGCGDAKLARALQPVAKQLKLRIHSFDLQAPAEPPEAARLVTRADVANVPLADGSCDVAVFCLSLMGTNWISFVEEAWRVLRADGKGECWVSEVKSRFGKVSRRKSVPEHSISKRTAKKLAQERRKKERAGADDDEEVDERELFPEDHARPEDDPLLTDETDVSAFVEVFRSRGFVLKQGSVDKSNKMFVRMEFVKHGVVTKGKHAGAAGSQAGRAQQQQQQQNGKKRFIEKEKAEEGLTPEQEAQVLKPCLYKQR